MSAGTAADSEQKDEDIFVSQHSSKPMLCVRPSVRRCFNCVEGFWKRLQATQFYEALEKCAAVNVWGLCRAN
jgi:hypothetical protein